MPRFHLGGRRKQPQGGREGGIGEGKRIRLGREGNMIWYWMG